MNWTKSTEKFPIDMGNYTTLTFNLSQSTLSGKQLSQLETNIQLARDAVVFFTALAGVKGLGGHTGGAYDIAPEMIIADGLRRDKDNKIYPIINDAAGHRVAIHYMMAAFNDHVSYGDLLHYREAHSRLPGHPEKDLTPGIGFSSGRLGHMWGEVNGIAFANPSEKIIMMDSDGSQQEGNCAEAAKSAVQHNLEVKLIIDDNDVTIAGHPSEYLSGFNLEKILRAYGLTVNVCENPENFAQLYQAMQKALTTQGPVALLNRRKMAPGIPILEGTPKAHDVISLDAAVQYLNEKGHYVAVNMLKSTKEPKNTIVYLGSTTETGKNRDDFGKIVSDILSNMTLEERLRRVRVIDSDLEGSCGLHHIRKKYPEIYISGGIQERNNFLTAAGFGSEPGKQGIFSTFAAFEEMMVSEITMARLNHRNVLVHYSHCGVDDIADNISHFGINIFFSDNGIQEGDNTRLYMPADPKQMDVIVRRVFNDLGLRFIYSTRSAVPYILDENERPFFDSENGYKFEPGKDEVIREGSAGYVVSYGEMLYRALDAVEKLRKEGIGVGLINKPTLNVVDGSMMEKLGHSPFVLVVESQNYKNGLGSRFGTWLLERGYNPKYARMGITRLGIGGLGEQIDHQRLNPENIAGRVQELHTLATQ